MNGRPLPANAPGRTETALDGVYGLFDRDIPPRPHKSIVRPFPPLDVQCIIEQLMCKYGGRNATTNSVSTIIGVGTIRPFMPHEDIMNVRMCGIYRKPYVLDAYIIIKRYRSNILLINTICINYYKTTPRDYISLGYRYINLSESDV